MRILFRSILLLAILAGSLHAQYAYTQIFDNLYFGPTTKQILIRPNLGNFTSTKRYSIWGWYKFAGETPAISNVIGLRNIELISSPDTSSRPFPDPEFDPCPYTLEQVQADQAIAQEVAQNPNCFPPASAQASSQRGQLFKTGTDILYINYDLTSLTDYSFIYLLQSGISSVGTSEMSVLGFTKLPLVKNVWTFFGFSADYQAGFATAYFRVFDGASQPLKDKVPVNFPNFQLTPLVQLVVAGVETNPYFESTSGFIGNIALVEMGLFYTSDLELVWMGFMPLNAYASNGVLIDLFFEQYQSGSPLISRGLFDARYSIVGPHTPIFSLDNNLVGVQFPPSSALPLDALNFGNENQLIKTFAFLISFNYTENMPKTVVLLQRGNPDQNGYFAYSLVKQGDGRVLTFEALGAKGPVSWTSQQVFKPNTKYTMETGLSISPNNTAYIVYWDTSGRTEISKLSDSFPFSSAPLQMQLLGNQAEAGTTGYISLYRFSALNSLSNILYYNFLTQTQDQTILNLNKYCLLRTNWYGNDFSCHICQNSILMLDRRQCAEFCPYGTKNAGNDACLPCLAADCAEITSTYWQIFKISDTYYELVPSRPIISALDYNNLFFVQIPGLGPNDYNYTLTPYPNNQTVGLNLFFNRSFTNQSVIVSMNQDRANPIFDANRNILYVTNTTIAANSTLFNNTGFTNFTNVTNGTNVTAACVIADSKARALRGLAIAALSMMAAMFGFVLILTLLCRCIAKRRVHDLGGIWKYMLHYWMRFQMIAFFLMLGIYMPCCIKTFLGQLYNISVTWNDALGRRITDNNINDPDFRAGIIPNPAPRQFAEYHVYPYILHNLGVWFIIQLGIFLFYIIMKIWDCFRPTSGSLFYRIFVWFEWTVLIVGYALIAMQAFVFAGLNFRKSAWTVSYFTCSFIVAVLYVAVATFFWIYCAFRLLGPSTYFYNPINYTKFYYFFAGYRNTRWARSYDLWWWLAYGAIGLLIGLLYDAGLAQLIAILAILVALFIVTLFIRPFTSILWYIIELLVQALIIASVALFLVIAIYNNNGCINCSDISFEVSLCWAIVMMLWLALLIGFLGLMLHFFLSLCLGDRYRRWCRPVREIVHTNYVTTTTDAYAPGVSQYGEMTQGVYRDTGLMGYDGAAVATHAYDTGADAYGHRVYTEEVRTENLGGYGSNLATGAAVGAATGLAATGTLAAQKSMQEFLHETAGAHTTAIKTQGIDLGIKAGQLASDNVDEEHLQPSVIRALGTPSQVDLVATETKSNFLAKKREQFYQEVKDAGAPLMPSVIDQKSSFHSIDRFAAPTSTNMIVTQDFVTRTPFDGVVTKTETVKTTNVETNYVGNAPTVLGGLGGMATDSYTVLRDGTSNLATEFRQVFDQTKKGF